MYLDKKRRRKKFSDNVQWLVIIVSHFNNIGKLFSRNIELVVRRDLLLIKVNCVL